MSDSTISAPQPDEDCTTFTDMDYDEWLAYGQAQGWCGPAVCSTHDGVPTSAEEDAEWEDGGDPCTHIIRMYETPEAKAAVDENYPPYAYRS
jgi:hypothetical protein